MEMEMEMQMEMRASEDVGIGEDITPPLSPLAFSLYDSHLHSHCSSCFSPIPQTHNSPSIPNSLLFCSSQCSSLLHFSSAEHHLLSTTSHGGADTSDLRLALRLLLTLSPQTLPRIRGLLTNRAKLMSSETGEDDEILTRIRDGAKAMAMARRMRNGDRGFDEGGEREGTVVEEAMLCLVLTNAVEVQVNGGQSVGIAVYDTAFSWINHSCSPNACYRFLTSAMELPQSRLRIVPAAAGDDQVNIENEIENSVCNKNKFKEGWQGLGPRIIVRSIKSIKKGEGVTVAYTDLLQPKAVRQSELWLKYRFICCCIRCSALPPTYADHALQEVLAAKLDSANLSSDQNFYRDEAIRKMTEYVDDAITEYLSVGNPESCCDKLENMLTRGLLYEQLDMEGKSLSNFRLHPLHYLSLNAYTTLASAYKIRAGHLLTLHPETNGHQLEAFDMSRTSTAYSLLLASAVHRLFLSESSLIVSVANFWISAGESLLSLAQSSVWNLFFNWGLLVSNVSSRPSHKCCKCSLMDKFDANFSCSQARHSEFEDISMEFLDCITNIAPMVWSFLIHSCQYLKVFKNPVDLSWLGTLRTSDMWDFQAPLGGTDVGSYFGKEGSNSRCELQVYTIQERINLFQLGVHCLLYGGILSSICYGQQSHLNCNIRHLIYGEENLIDKYCSTK